MPSLALANQLASTHDVVICESKNFALSIDSHPALRSLKVDHEHVTTTLNEGYGGTSELWTGGLVRSIASDRSVICCSTLEALHPISEALSQLTADIRLDVTGYKQQSTVVLESPLRGSAVELSKSVKVYLNTKVTDITTTRCGKPLISYKYEDTVHSQEFDICIISAGTFGTLALLKSSALVELPHQLKLLVHPKFSIGCIKLNKFARLKAIIGDYSIHSFGYIYSRYLFSELPSNLNNTFSHSLRFSSRRTRLMIRLIKYMPRYFAFRQIYFYLFLVFDTLLVNLLELLHFSETVDIELFINDELSPSYITSDGKKVYITNQIEYVNNLFAPIEKFCLAHFKNNVSDISLSLKKAIYLHSHLCSSLWEYRDMIKELERKNIYCLSSLLLPPGYYNPMYELLNIATQIYQDLCTE